MPCKDGREEDWEKMEAILAKARLDSATHAACQAFKVLESHPAYFQQFLDDRALAWWANHKQEDALKIT